MPKTRSLLLSTFLLLSHMAQASLTDIPRFDAPVTVDGELDEQVWQKAASTELTTVTWPHENTTSPVKTR